MEKIVTQIGDVTIERRVTKAPTQKFDADAAVKNTQSQSAAKIFTPKYKLQDQIKSLPSYEVLKEERRHSSVAKQYNLNVHAPVLNRNFNSNAQIQMGKSLVAQREMEQKLSLPKEIFWDRKRSNNTHEKIGYGNQYDEAKGALTFDDIKSVCQSEKVRNRSEEAINNAMEALRHGGNNVDCKRATNVEAAKYLQSGNTIGSKSANLYNTSLSSNLAVERIDRSEGLSKVLREKSSAISEETAFKAKKAQCSGRGQNLYNSNNHGPLKSIFQSNYPIFPDSSNQNFPNWRRLTQAGLTIEKKSNSEERHKKFLLENSYNSVPQNVQKKAFTSKSPIHLSSDEEKQTGEDTDYDLKELEDFEEGFNNDSDGYEEEDDVNAPVEGVTFGGCNSEAPINFDSQDRLNEKSDNTKNTNVVKHIKTFQENICEKAENTDREAKFHQRSGSPIVLSSEEDDKNDEDLQIMLKEPKNLICQKNNLTSIVDQQRRKLSMENVQDTELSEIIELEESLKAYENDFLDNSHEIGHFLLSNLKRDQEMKKASEKPLTQQGLKRNSSLSVEKTNTEFLSKRSNKGEKIRKLSEDKNSDANPDEDATRDPDSDSIENEDIEEESDGIEVFPGKNFTNEQLSSINKSKNVDTYEKDLTCKTAINDKFIKQETNLNSVEDEISDKAEPKENLKVSRKDNHQNIQLKMEPVDHIEMKETSQNTLVVSPTIKTEIHMSGSDTKLQKNCSSEKNEISADDRTNDEIGKSEDMNDLVCNDLMELMKKGEIEGEMEDDKDYESDEEKEGKKTGTKRRADENERGEEDSSSSKKNKSDKTDENGGGKEEGEKEGRENEKIVDKSKVTSANLRKNIREVMDETKLDEATLSAQRQEAERLKRLQEQQRIIRELQKQIALNRQNQKSQSRVLSLLQGNSQTSILKTSSSTPPISVQSKSPNHVLVKLSNGQQTSLNNKKMMELLKNSKTKMALTKPTIPKTLLKQGMVSPSVSIAPIVKKEAPVDDKKKKKGDVVTLSSDSEDDCIVLSEEDESEPEEDPANSGMHTSDKYNVPDEQGRVIVNVGHPESEKDLFLAPQIARIIKPHQIGGIRFLYDNVIESLERFQSSTGFGCILAHSMGLGKTLQIVSFSDIFLRYTSAKTILCIMPINTIQNWLAEFNMWLPKENNTDQEIRCRDFDLFIVNESLKNINSRSRVILDWHKNGGVLLMGYELFRLLSLKKSYKSKKKRKESEEKEDDAKNKELVEELYAALVRPGPDLVICDEGHRIKNSHATTSQALKQIRTKRRIVLTGYPLQNNLLEYWCMVDFVRPNYLGSKAEFSNMFERPIQNGQCIDSTPQDKRLMRYRAHVLHSLLEGFVQRRSHAVLQSTLPEKEEYVLLLRFTPFQRKLYDTFMNEVVRTVAVPNPLKAFAVCCKIWNHPDVLYNFLKKKGEEIDLDLEEALPSSLQPSNYPFGQIPVDGVNQLNPSPQAQAWPRRGPGSRGGKVRQCSTTRRPGQRGRKPAATVSPNSVGGCEKREQESENYNSNNYTTGFSNFANETLMESERRNGHFVARDYNQYPSTEFGNHSTFGGTGYDTKNPLENLENLSSGDFQNKRFYHHHMESGIQTGFTNASCLSMQGNSNFSQNISQSNNPDMKNGFNSNPPGSDSRFTQSDAPKLFDYNQDFNSSFYHSGNFQTSQSNVDFERSKTNFSRNSSTTDSNSYFQNSQYVNARENNLSFNIQQSNSNNNNNNINSNYSSFTNESSDQNFQQGSLNKHYQTSSTNSGYNDSNCTNSGINYQNSIIEPQPNSCSGDVQNKNNYNDASTNCIGGNDSNFQGSSLNCNSSFSNNYRECSNFNSNQSNSGRSIDSSSNFKGNEPGFINRSGYSQGYWSESGWHPENFEPNKNVGEFKTGVKDDFLQIEKYNVYSSANTKNDMKQFLSEDLDKKSGSNLGVRVKSEIELDVKSVQLEGDKTVNTIKEDTFKIKKEDECKSEKKEEFKSPEIVAKKEDQSLPYDWATDLFKNYVTGIIENSSKMAVFFHILTESINLGDRILVFSQSLLTLDLIEDYLQCRNVPNKDEKWMKHRNYFRLDGSTPGLEREKLINEFNGNPNIFIFLVSTRAGSLGINLVGANRVVVFDASWNPCHDTQAVCRVYRYGQQKPCFVYRLVMDNCLEKKIYDRQINKQGMADRVVDELNPDAHLSIKEVTNLCWDDQEDTTIKDFASLKHNYKDHIIKVLLENCSKLLSKEPFQHESLLIDRKEKKLSQAEKRLAKRSYELEKQAANQPKNMYSFFPNANNPRNFGKPIASVRPMQSEMNSRIPLIQNRSKWIPAEVWQKQGMSAQEMTLPLDVVIPTNTPDKTSIVLKAGQRVMVLKSPKGIYMQLENGKIIAIRTAFKVGQSGPGSQSKGDDIKKDASVSVSSTLKNNPNLTITSKSSAIKIGGTKPAFARGPEKRVPLSFTSQKPKQILGKAKPFLLNRKFQSVTAEIKQRLLTGKANMEVQEDKLPLIGPNDKDEVIITNDKNENLKFEEPIQRKIDQPDQRGTAKPDELSNNKGEMNNSLETLRKVTENITDECKSEGNSENSQPQVNSLKNYRHNFSSQMKNKTHVDDEKGIKTGNENEGGNVKSTQNPSAPFNGNENVQNWFTNQSYPPVDPYSNYFPGYYNYAPGAGPMMNPYDSFYPSNYNHPMGRSMSGGPPIKQDLQSDASKSTPQQQNQSPCNQNFQQDQNSSTCRNSIAGNTSMYPPYPNPYPYPYNYPTNSGFNNQGYSFSAQNQSSQQSQQSAGSNSTNSNSHNQTNPYDSSMYSAFHRPDGHFQAPESQHPPPYHRQPYPGNPGSGFFPYNSSYRSYRDQNYHYGTNFNPYMHPPAYGYHIQNPPPTNSNQSFNQTSTESSTNSN